MADPNTIRILELDGGGERGYLSTCWLEKFVNQWGIEPSTIANYFDVICGTSVGGIIALGLAYGRTPDDNPTTGIKQFFTEQGPYIFSLSSLLPSWRPNSVTKAGLVVANIPFYQSSGPTAPLYGAGLLTATIQDTFGSSTLQDLNTNVVVPAYRRDTSTFTLFSNANISGYVGQNELISNIALATSAAPAYLPAWTFGGHTYIDGGVFQNNPSSLGVALGKALKPASNRVCLLSIGTGLGTIGFDNSGSSGIPLAPNPLSVTSFSSTVVVTVPTTSILTDGQSVTISGATTTGDITPENLNITATITILSGTTFSYTATSFSLSTTTGGGSNVVVDYITDPPDESIIETWVSLFEIGLTGGQESVAKALQIESLYTLDKFYYYRFNPVLDPTKNTELDNTDDSILEYYSETADTLYNEDQDNISIFLGHLQA